MAVTEDILLPFLEGSTVQQVINDRRLFITDYKILKNLPTKDNRAVNMTGDEFLLPNSTANLNQDLLVSRLMSVIISLVHDRIGRYMFNVH